MDGLGHFHTLPECLRPSEAPWARLPGDIERRKGHNEKALVAEDAEESRKPQKKAGASTRKVQAAEFRVFRDQPILTAREALRWDLLLAVLCALYALCG
jgi:hypothetical protein